MSKHCKGRKVSLQKYVLCQMPPEWTTLPVHDGARPPSGSIAVYTKYGPFENLIYAGYICATAPEILPVSALLPPPIQLSDREKHKLLQDKIRTEEAEATARANAEALPAANVGHITEDQKIRDADSAASSNSAIQGVVKTEQNIAASSEEMADASKQQIERPEAAFTSKHGSSNNNNPFSFETLRSSENVFPELVEMQTEDFGLCFEPWEDALETDMWNKLVETFLQQSSPSRPADVGQTSGCDDLC